MPREERELKPRIPPGFTSRSRSHESHQKAAKRSQTPSLSLSLLLCSSSGSPAGRGDYKSIENSYFSPSRSSFPLFFLWYPHGRLTSDHGKATGCTSNGKHSKSFIYLSIYIFSLKHQMHVLSLKPKGWWLGFNLGLSVAPRSKITFLHNIRKHRGNKHSVSSAGCSIVSLISCINVLIVPVTLRPFSPQPHLCKNPTRTFHGVSKYFHKATGKQRPIPRLVAYQVLTHLTRVIS